MRLSKLKLGECAHSGGAGKFNQTTEVREVNLFCLVAARKSREIYLHGSLVFQSVIYLACLCSCCRLHLKCGLKCAGGGR